MKKVNCRVSLSVRGARESGLAQEARDNRTAGRAWLDRSSLPTRRWRKVDSNPRSPVRKIYANTEIAGAREQRGRRSAGEWREMPICHRRVISAADHVPPSSS